MRLRGVAVWARRESEDCAYYVRCRSRTLKRRESDRERRSDQRAHERAVGVGYRPDLTVVIVNLVFNALETVL